MPHLKIENLTVDFKTENGIFNAVKRINISIEKGEIMGLVGESGSGKSVSSLGMMRLLEKNAIIKGKIILDGINLLDLSEKEMQGFRGNKIGMIFQEPMTSLNPVITCGNQVIETILVHNKSDKKDAKAKAIQLFEEVKLPDPLYIFDKFPHELSGGQKQRVMIAMALACDPDLLIADEPTTALDVTVQKSILQLLLKLKTERNMSMIFISHDLGVIGEVADKITVMFKGEIVEQGLVEEVFLHPQNHYTKGLLACRPSLDLKLKKLPTISDFMSIKGIGDFRESQIESLFSKYSISENEIQERRKTIYNKTPILKIENLKIWFPKKSSWFSTKKDFIRAVDDISFEVYPGETFGLVGESGCGKTTLSRTILKLIEPTSGNISFDGKDITNLSADEMRPIRKDIQIIFQDPYSSLNPVKTIGDTLTEPLIVHKILNNKSERKAYIIDLLEKVGLSAEHFNRYPHEFSGGQRQRVVIARALALKPKFIICDESVSALDVSVQAQVLNLLKSLQKEFNLTYIFISHDMAVVKHMSDMMMVMNKGKMEEIGFPSEIYKNPKTDYTKNLIEAIPKGIIKEILN